MNVFSSCVLTFALLLNLSTSLYAQTIHYVHAVATGANDGTTWADAYPYLQDALAAAQSGDEIWVARGVYYPDEGAGVSAGDPAATFALKSDVALYGGFSGTEAQRNGRNPDPATNGTVLSGDIDGNDATTAGGVVEDPANIVGSNSSHVVSATGPVGSAVLDGFTITAGAASGNASDAFASRGGGVYVQDSDPHFENLLITGSTATGAGGGLYAEGPALPTFSTIRIVRNERIGFYLLGPAPEELILTNIEVAENESGLQLVDVTATINDAVLRDNQGVGLGLARATVTLTNSVVSGNTSGLNGAGIQNMFGTLAVRNCTISGNRNTRSDSQENGGGGIYNNGSLVVALTIFENNQATSRGGGLYNTGQAAAILVGTAFIGNEAEADGGGIYSAIGDDLQLATTNLEVYNSFFFRNTATRGGGIYNNEVLETMNLVFSGNAAQGGGAVFNDAYGRVVLRNVTASGNTAEEAGAGVQNQSLAGSSVVIHNSIFFGNGAENDSELFTTFGGSQQPIAVGHSLVQGGLPDRGTTDLGGNLDADPLFGDADGPDDVVGTLDDDLRLMDGSPVIDAGNNEWLPPDLHDVDGDGDVVESWPVDIGDPPGGSDIQLSASSPSDAKVFGRTSVMQNLALEHGFENSLLPERARSQGSRVDPGAYEGPGGSLPRRYWSAGNYRWLGTGGDPVSTFTGELFFSEERLLDLGGPLPLFLQPYYAALLESDGRVASALGPNWSHNFEARLIPVDATTIEAVSSQGRVTTFAQQQDGSWEQTDALDLPLQLVSDGDGFLLADPRGGPVKAFDADGRLTKVEDGRGNTLTLSYDADGRLATVSDGLGRFLNFGHSVALERLAVVSDGTRTVTFAYDGQRRLASLTNAAGETTTYAYDGDSNFLTAATQPNGDPYYTQTFDPDGRVTTQANAYGDTWQFGYDAHETTVTDPNGDGFKHAYTSAGQVETYTDPLGNHVSMDYDESERRSQITDRLGGVTRTTYHAASGLPETVTEANGGVTTYSYTARTIAAAAKRSAADLTVYDLTSITLPDGGTVGITRDASGNATSVTNPAGETWNFTYNDRGQVLTAANPEGGTTTATYNSAGMLASSTDPTGNTTTFGYDNLRRLTTITRADGAARSFTYDGADRLLSETDEDSRTWTFAYDENGNLTSATDPSGKQIRYAYDAMDRLARVTDRTGGVTEITYDALGNRETVTDPNGRTTTYGYDALSRLTSIIDAESHTWRLTYDAEGVLATVTDPLGNTTTFITNVMGWVTQATDALGNASGATYDIMGRITGVQDALGFSTTYGHDVLGRVAQTTLPGGSAAAYARDGLGLIEQVTDPNGEVWGYARDAQGRLTATTDPLGRTTSYTHDVRNRPSRITLPGDGVLALAHDDIGRLKSLTYSDGTSLSYDHDPNGRLIEADGVNLARDAAGRLTASNGVDLGRNDGGLLESVTYAPGKTVTYAYDGRGLVTSVTDWLDATTTLAYDGAGRLTAISRPNGVTTTYSYDAAGRLLEIEETTEVVGKRAAALASTVLLRDARGQITNATRDLPAVPAQAPTPGAWKIDAAGQLEGATYDPLGHLEGEDARTYTWDLAGRLTSYTENGTTVEFEYDAFGYQTSRTKAGASTTFVWNYGLGLPTVAVERAGDTDTRYYVSTPDGRILYTVDASDESRQFYHYDEMGNTQIVTDDHGAVLAAYAYSPYGEVIGATGDLDNSITWQGAYGVLCEGTLCYARARYYAPRLRRFLSPDPIKSLHPAEMTPYQYARGNPHGFVDPTGLKPEIHIEIRDRNTFEFLAYFLYRHRGRGWILYDSDDDDPGMTHIDPPSLELDFGPPPFLDNLQEDLAGGVLLGDAVIPDLTAMEEMSLPIVHAGRAVYNGVLDASQAAATNAASVKSGALDDCPAIDPTDPAAFILNAGASYGKNDRSARSTCLVPHYDLYWLPVWLPNFREARWKWLTWWWTDWVFYGWQSWWDYWEQPIVSRKEEDQQMLRSQIQIVF